MTIMIQDMDNTHDIPWETHINITLDIVQKTGFYKTRQIEIQHFLIQDKMENNDIFAIQIPDEENPTYSPTKQLKQNNVDTHDNMIDITFERWHVKYNIWSKHNHQRRMGKWKKRTLKEKYQNKT